MNIQLTSMGLGTLRLLDAIRTCKMEKVVKLLPGGSWCGYICVFGLTYSTRELVTE